MKKEILAIIIVVGAILLGFAGSFGYFLGQKQIEPSSKPEVSISTLSTSKIVSNWQGTAEGEVKKIEGQVLTLSAENEILSIPISEDAQVQSLQYEGAERTINNLEFKDIKTGDKLTVYLRAKGDLFEGYLIVILPQE